MVEIQSKDVLKSVGETKQTITEKQLQGLTALIGADKIDDLIDVFEGLLEEIKRDSRSWWHWATLLETFIYYSGGSRYQCEKTKQIHWIARGYYRYWKLALSRYIHQEKKRFIIG